MVHRIKQVIIWRSFIPPAKGSGFSDRPKDKDNNIVFEYDEPAHQQPKYKKKDKKKQESIIEKVNPALFIRYDERNNRLYDVISDKELR